MQSTNNSDTLEDNTIIGNDNKKSLKISKRASQKLHKTCGMPYIMKNGKYNPGKQFSYITECCKNNCCAQFNYKAQEDIFKKYYSLGSVDAQSAFLFYQISVQPVARHYTPSEIKPRTKTRHYCLPNSKGDQVPICKYFFRTLLCLSDGRIDRLLKTKVDFQSLPPKDQRGRHKQLSSISECISNAESRMMDISGNKSIQLTQNLNMDIDSEDVTEKVNISSEKPINCCSNNCIKNCPNTDKIKFEFDSLDTIKDQNLYISKFIKITPAAHHSEAQSIRKNFTRKYFLPDCEGTPIPVCKVLFEKIFRLSSGRIDRILKNSTRNLKLKFASK